MRWQFFNSSVIRLGKRLSCGNCSSAIAKATMPVLTVAPAKFSQCLKDYMVQTQHGLQRGRGQGHNGVSLDQGTYFGNEHGQQKPGTIAHISPTLLTHVSHAASMEQAQCNAGLEYSALGKASYQEAVKLAKCATPCSWVRGGTFIHTHRAVCLTHTWL